MPKDSLETILNYSLQRKPKRLSFLTTYDHSNIYEWLHNILPSWEIIIPTGLTCALSEWPTSGISRDIIKQWLDENKHTNSDDLLDGACEPLAFYLSSKIHDCLDIINNNNINSIYQTIKAELDNLDPLTSAKLIFGDFIKAQHASPLFWGPDIVGSYKHYLFGHVLAKEKLLDAADLNNIAFNIMPLYVLNYIYDCNELTNTQLKYTTEETAQYSLHVVGLVFDKSKQRVIVADPNGVLIPGSNMEFLSIPLQKRGAKASTTVSRFDIDSFKRKRDETTTTTTTSNKK